VECAAKPQAEKLNNLCGARHSLCVVSPQVSEWRLRNTSLACIVQSRHTAVLAGAATSWLASRRCIFRVALRKVAAAYDRSAAWGNGGNPRCTPCTYVHLQPMTTLD